MKRKGFTLVELLVVVTVIDVLAVVVLAAISEARYGARIARMALELKEMEKAFLITYLDENRDVWWSEAEIGLGPNPTLNAILAKDTGPLSTLSNNLPNIDFSDSITGGNYLFDYDGDADTECGSWYFGANIGINISNEKQRNSLDKYFDGEVDAGQDPSLCGKIRYDSSLPESWLFYRISNNVAF